MTKAAQALDWFHPIILFMDLETEVSGRKHTEKKKDKEEVAVKWDGLEADGQEKFTLRTDKYTRTCQETLN